MVMRKLKTLHGMTTVKIPATGVMTATILAMPSILLAGIPIKVVNGWVFQNGMPISSI